MSNKATSKQKKLIQFAHPNGFPAKCFSHLFKSIEYAEINYVELMGHNHFKLNNNLENLAFELIDSIEKRFREPCIGIGHSTGATLILIAASIRPDLFKKLILIEPILYHPLKRLAIMIMKKIGLSDFIGPVKRTLKRKSVFKSKKAAYDYFEGKALFKNFDPQSLSDYVDFGLIKTLQGYELAFSKEIEAEIYRSTYTRVPKGIETITGTLIYADNSYMFKAYDAKWWKSNFKKFKTITVSGGHLFPLEKPLQTARIISQLLI